jgi:hypothetical protein
MGIDMTFEEILPLIKQGKKYKLPSWEYWYSLDQHDAFDKEDIMRTDWQIKGEPMVRWVCFSKSGEEWSYSSEENAKSEMREGDKLIKFVEVVE